MNGVLRFLRDQPLAIAAMLVALAGAAFAANGAGVKLGGANEATLATTLKSTAPGPAVDLRSAAGQPPFRVSSTKVVPRLNAAMLDGTKGSALAPSRGSTAYAPASGSTAYAPASGSPNYMAAGHARLLRAIAVNDSLGGTAGSRSIINGFVDIPPAAGTLSVQLSGYCESPSGVGTEKVGYSIALGGGVGPSIKKGACELSASTPVSANGSQFVIVDWGSADPNASIDAAVLIWFTPSS